MATDPESRWLVTAWATTPWHDAPVTLQRVARFVGAVRDRYLANRGLGILTEVELVILNAIASGKSAPKVAHHLGRSAHTVRTHIRNLYGKLDVHGRREAIAKARALGLLSP